ncbi:cation:proton antiporter [Candidatus Albibeggiatoa sp. nov. NOAA]|uniref:cation:proton antiporter n=1 Tax=Candidatus Albibeggiatoa sp. nov. NOAA TaxID=3162724 RepID=UPI003301FE63|nr:cation:proton antiporter [Thiotrichaceae bacterium]
MSFLKRTQANNIPLWLFIALLLVPTLGFAGGGGEHAVNFLWIAVFLLIAKMSSLVEKWGQPAVLGELIVGVLLGNLVLFGFQGLEHVKHDELIKFLAELGVVILLFQIGLESKVEEMKKVGMKAFLVAIVGVAAPFILGTYVIGPWLMPGLSSNAYLFLGATLTATSVGITGRVFKDLNKLQTPEAQIVLGAAVIDDVIGLIILAVVSAIVTTGAVELSSIGLITFKAFIFLVGSLVIGQFIAKIAGEHLPRIHAGYGMQFTLAISFCLIFAYLAYLVGLAPIVGAFAAGLVLEPLHFEAFDNPEVTQEVKDIMDKSSDENAKQEIHHIMEKHGEHHIEELIAPLGYFLVPLFFIMTGMQVNLATLADPSILAIALAVTVVAFLGKIVAGLAAGSGVNKWIIGWGMAPRGEVGLIFAMIGKQLGVVSDAMFSVIIIMVILTTLLTPIILNHLLKKQA